MINVGITEKHLFEVHYMKTVLIFEITLFYGNYFFDVGIEGKASVDYATTLSTVAISSTLYFCRQCLVITPRLVALGL